MGRLHQKLALARGLGGVKREAPAFASDDDKRRLVILPHRMAQMDEATMHQRRALRGRDVQRQARVRESAQEAASVPPGFA